MISKKCKLMFATTIAMGLAGSAHAEGLYGMAGIGMNFQDGNSEPYGSNIAVDPDFPGEFDSGDGVVGVFGIGYHFDGPFRVEGRFGLHQADFNDRKFGTGARAGEEYILDGDIESTSLTIEGFYDIPMDGAFAPYVKAGVGVSHNRYAARLGGAGVADFDAFDGTSDGYYDAYADESSTEFTWNIGFGGSVALNDRFTLFGEYQYASFGDGSTGQDSFTDGFRVDAAAHEVLLGLRTSF